MLRVIVGIWMGLLLSLYGSASSRADEILTAEQAFSVTVSRVGDRLVRIVVDVEPGYALYRDQLALWSGADGADRIDVDWPVGEVVDEAGDGDRELYRARIAVDVKLPDPVQDGDFIRVRLQGCVPSRRICLNPVVVSVRALGSM